MKFRREPKEELELNLTPLIDVVFLLLIFFMVSTTFQRESELSLQLPRAAEDAPVQPVEERIEIQVNAAGRYYVDGRELVNSDRETLQNALVKITEGRRDLLVTLRADAQTPHQSVITAMDAAGQLGLNRITIATTRSE